LICLTIWRTIVYDLTLLCYDNKHHYIVNSRRLNNGLMDWR
jgi:hypothetical protein